MEQYQLYRFLQQLTEDAVFDALFDNGFDPDEEQFPDFVAIYTKKDGSDVKVAVNSVHYEGDDDFNPDDYFVDYAYSLEQALAVPGQMFDFRR